MAQQQLDSLESEWPWFYKDSKQVVVCEQTQRVVKTILSVKDVVSAVIAAEPHASILWAGVLVILLVRSQVRLSVPLLTY